MICKFEHWFLLITPFFQNCNKSWVRFFGKQSARSSFFNYFYIKIKFPPFPTSDRSKFNLNFWYKTDNKSEIFLEKYSDTSVCFYTILKTQKCDERIYKKYSHESNYYTQFNFFPVYNSSFNLAAVSSHSVFRILEFASCIKLKNYSFSQIALT